MEAELLAEATQRSVAIIAAWNCGKTVPATVFALDHGVSVGHYHRRAVLDVAVQLIKEQPAFEAIVFMGCGYAITETLILDAIDPRTKAIFMDRHVDHRVRRRDHDVEATSFEELGHVISELTVPTLIVGINAILSCYEMRDDPGFPAFVAACVANEYVHRDAVLVSLRTHWKNDANYAVVPVAELATVVREDPRVKTSV